jgi:glycosyltransferase involved in cell wall biosynthesis
MDLLLLNGDRTPFYEQLESAGVKIFSLTHGKIKGVYNPFLIFRIIPYLKRYDIIHTHLFPTLYWVALAKLLSFCRVKLVFTEHSTSNTRIENRFFRVIDRFIYLFYAKIGCITNEVKDVLQQKLFIKDSKLVTIENGIYLSKYISTFPACRTDFGLNESDKLLIMVAGFRPQKDQDTIICALTLLPENVKLLLVGDGTRRLVLENLAKEQNVSHRVLFLGVRSDVAQLLKMADIIVMSSHYEGLSLSCIEAMSSGRPLIASRVPGLQNIVENAGLLFEHENSQDLSEKIIMLLNNNKLYTDIANRCTTRAQEYDIEKMVEKYVNLYHELL